MRAGDLYAAVRCGDVGIYGRGCHAHNDLLAFELSFGARPVVVDPGAYLYTADPTARNGFRSTGVHSTLQIDGAEQNEIRKDRLFAMLDRASPAVLGWEAGEALTTLTGRHRGFQALAAPATHTRTLTLDAGRDCLEILDRVDSVASHELSWVFPLEAEHVELLPTGSAIARFADLELRIDAEGLTAEVMTGWVSASYGERHPVPVLRLSGNSQPGRHEVRIVLAVSPFGRCENRSMLGSRVLPKFGE